MLLNAMSQKRLRSFRSTKHYLFLMTMKKWTWQKRRDKIRNARVGIKTSGFFNAGLTPCSHTTTTKSDEDELFFRDYLYLMFFIVVVCFLLLEWELFLLCLVKYSPGGEYSLNSLVVVVCEHGVSPALKNPEVFIPPLAFLISSSSSVMFISSSSS